MITRCTYPIYAKSQLTGATTWPSRVVDLARDDSSNRLWSSTTFQSLACNKHKHCKKRDNELHSRWAYIAHWGGQHFQQEIPACMLQATPLVWLEVSSLLARNLWLLQEQKSLTLTRSIPATFNKKMHSVNVSKTCILSICLVLNFSFCSLPPHCPAPKCENWKLWATYTR